MFNLPNDIINIIVCYTISTVGDFDIMYQLFKKNRLDFIEDNIKEFRETMKKQKELLKKYSEVVLNITNHIINYKNFYHLNHFVHDREIYIMYMPHFHCRFESFPLRNLILEKKKVVFLKFKYGVNILDKLTKYYYPLEYLFDYDHYQTFINNAYYVKNFEKYAYDKDALYIAICN